MYVTGKEKEREKKKTKITRTKKKPNKMLQSSSFSIVFAMFPMLSQICTTICHHEHEQQQTNK